MKTVYPVVIDQTEAGWYRAEVPDFERSTQGKSLADAISMARDLIELTGVTMEDYRQEVPEPSDISSIKVSSDKIVTLVDVDFKAYRAMLDNRSVRKNCTLPSWLNVKAEAAEINFSQVLQEALMNKLGLMAAK